MKLTIMRAIAAFIVMGTTIASVEEANAVVCACGVYRAGCAGPRGAVVAPRGASSFRTEPSCGALSSLRAR